MAPPSRTPERDPLNPMAYEQKKVRFVTDLTPLTLCRGTVPACRRVTRSPSSECSPFNVYIPVRSNVNNGSECAPLNFVMASAAFRLCGHHRGRHIALRMNSSMIGTSRADFRSSWCRSLSNASKKPFGIHDKCALRIVVGWIFVADFMRHHGFEMSTRSPLRENVKVFRGHGFPQCFDPSHLHHC